MAARDARPRPQFGPVRSFSRSVSEAKREVEVPTDHVVTQHKAIAQARARPVAGIGRPGRLRVEHVVHVEGELCVTVAGRQVERHCQVRCGEGIDPVVRDDEGSIAVQIDWTTIPFEQIHRKPVCGLDARRASQAPLRTVRIADGPESCVALIDGRDAWRSIIGMRLVGSEQA